MVTVAACPFWAVFTGVDHVSVLVLFPLDKPTATVLDSHIGSVPAGILELHVIPLWVGTVVKLLVVKLYTPLLGDPLIVPLYLVNTLTSATDSPGLPLEPSTLTG